MNVHLIDGTYELFRHFFAVPSAADVNGQEIGAVRGVLTSVLSIIEHGATHIGVATDHVVESFRLICTPDKDLSQCVVGTRVVQLDRRRDILRDEAGVVAKFGVKPRSIPAYLAVVGDSADGFPGLPGWGPKAAALTLSQYAQLEDIPKDWREWHPSIRKARLLSESLFNAWNDALLFRTLATLRLDVPVFDTVEDLRWKGPRENFEEYCRRMKSSDLPGRVTSAKAMRSQDA